MWKKPTEGNLPLLAGVSDYDKQVLLSRAIPVLGGISENTFAVVMWHSRKNINNVVWSGDVHTGKLTNAIRKVIPRRRNGPWTVLCDNESFLQHDVCLRVYVSKSIHLWQLPVKSLDFNSIETFWSRVQRWLC